MIRLLSGDCRDVLATLPAESVQCVVTSPPYYALRSYLDAEHPDKHREIGSEASPDEYLATMVAVFREVRRVLRRDGTCWVNMGDSYNANQGAGFDTNRDGGARKAVAASPRVNSGLAAKQLLLMPARLALALQAHGWWVRSDIIWHKPNPMPESVTDRPTSAHEHVFLLTRSARYFYDADAVRESSITNDPRRPYTSMGAKQLDGRDTWHSGEARNGDDFSSRSLRNVWTIATAPYKDAHFATFPAELAERCIKAGTSERGCCAACGKPWVRVTEGGAATGKAYNDHSLDAQAGMSQPSPNKMGGSQFRAARAMDPIRTTGWQPGCQCNAEAVPCVVLDPFAGAGTTLLVADRLQRDAIGIELNTTYTELVMERCRADAPLFTAFPPAEDPEETRMGDLFAGDEYERPKSVTTPRNDGNRWNENNGRGFMPRQTPDMAAD